MKIQVHLIYQKEKYNWVMVAYVRRQTDPCEVRPAHSTEQVLGQVLHRKQKKKILFALHPVFTDNCISL